MLLIHGWPGGVIEFCDLIPRLVAAGHDVIVPSLPGFGFSEAPPGPLNVAGVADRLRALVGDGAGLPSATRSRAATGVRSSGLGWRSTTRTASPRCT